jgi:hypothetical protein
MLYDFFWGFYVMAVSTSLAPLSFDCAAAQRLFIHSSPYGYFE